MLGYAIIGATLLILVLLIVVTVYFIWFYLIRALIEFFITLVIFFRLMLVLMDIRDDFTPRLPRGPEMQERLYGRALLFRSQRRSSRRQIEWNRTPGFTRQQSVKVMSAIL